MISTYNLTKLNSLLQDFYRITQIRITVFDETFHELAAYPEPIAPICRLLRTDKAAKQKCVKCDADACRTSQRRHTPYTYECHAGLTESIIPLVLGNITIGYLLFGHVFSYRSHKEGWAKIQERCASYQVDMDALKKACWERPLISEDYIRSASHIMQAVASFLCLDRMVVFKKQELPVQIDDYIMQHYTEALNVQAICEHFQIGKTFLYEIAKQNYGIGIAAHIRKLRITKAKELLTSRPDLPIREVAFQCGFADYNYFITVFKRMTGLSPKQYCQQAKQDFL